MMVGTVVARPVGKTRLWVGVGVSFEDLSTTLTVGFENERENLTVYKPKAVIQRLALGGLTPIKHSQANDQVCRTLYWQCHAFYTRLALRAPEQLHKPRQKKTGQSGQSERTNTRDPVPQDQDQDSIIKIPLPTMVIIRCAFTAPMRQTTRKKFYSLLEDKSRNPLKYVQDFTSCKVTQESRNADGQLTNLTRLLRVQGFEEEIEEFVVFHPPMMVTFETKNPSAKSFITNMVSVDCADPSLLYMTSTYEFHRPDLEEGSEKHREAVEWHTEFGKKTVAHVVELAERGA
ncbi:hypothetical protein Q7P37_008396 [Cladosporium fusiforme]